MTAFPGESTEYRAARDRLLQREIELRREMEAVAAERRALPPGGEVPEDYVFEGADGEVRLSELFAPGKDSLAVYSFMFPRHPGDERPGPASGETARLPREEGPCPSCVGLLDQLDGAVEHSGPLVNFVVIAKAPLPRLLTFARERGWSRLRILSSNGNPLPPRLPGGDAGRAHDADAERVRARRRHGPALLGLRAVLGADRPRTGPAAQRHDRAVLEPPRLHPGRPPGGVGRAAVVPRRDMMRRMWWGLIGFVIGLLIVMVVLGMLMERGGSSSDESGHP